MTHERISIDPNVMFGKPVIKGTRIKVETILRFLGKGTPVEELLESWPGLTREDIQAAQLYAADLIPGAHHEAAE